MPIFFRLSARSPSRFTAGSQAYRKAHPTNWTSTGIDAWNKYMDKSLPNTIYGAGCAFWTASSCFTGVGLLVNALIILS